MEENLNKYYTPDITEFHIGFEYEILIKESNSDKVRWAKMQNPFKLEYLEKWLEEKENSGLRVKYLDKEDIESLGWKQSEKASCQYFKGVYTLIKMNDNKITIRYISDGGTLFRGTIKNKSELIKLLKQLNLNI